MGRSPHLNALEAMQKAVFVANKTASHRITVRGFRILLALYNASSEGKALTRNGLVDRLDSMGNTPGRGAALVATWRLREQGYLVWEEKSYGAVVTLTMSGVNYVKAVERAIRRIRWNTL